MDELQLPARTKQPAIEGEVMVTLHYTWNGIDLSFEAPRAPFARAYDVLEELYGKEVMLNWGKPKPVVEREG